MDLSQVVALVRAHAWLALAIIVVGFLVRLTAKDSRVPVFKAINVPEQWQPVVVLALGTLADVLQEVASGKPWSQAINAALVISIGVLALKAYFYGREPAWLQTLAMVVPSALNARVAPGDVAKVSGPAAVHVPDGSSVVVSALTGAGVVVTEKEKS